MFILFLEISYFVVKYLVCLHIDNIEYFEEAILNDYIKKYGDIDARAKISLYFAEIIIPYLLDYIDYFESYGFTFSFAWAYKIRNKNELLKVINRIKTNTFRYEDVP